jgi:hypothetical protein
MSARNLERVFIAHAHRGFAYVFCQVVQGSCTAYAGVLFTVSDLT